MNAIRFRSETAFPAARKVLSARPFSVAAVFTLSAVFCASCGDSGSESEPENAQSMYCRYDFEASVRKGPNAGLTLHGQLYLVEKSPSHTEGGLYIPARGSTPEQHIPAVGEIDAANNLSLTFSLDGGK